MVTSEIEYRAFLAEADVYFNEINRAWLGNGGIEQMAADYERERDDGKHVRLPDMRRGL